MWNKPGPPVNAVPGKGEAIENMAEVHHESGNQRSKGGSPTGNHGNGQEFHRAGVDDEGENGRLPPAETGLDHE